MTTPSHGHALLEFNNVTVMRGDTVALDRVSFSIQPGENVAIIGPNGSGKSTLIKTITRECYPFASSNGVDGIPAAEIKPPLRILGESTWDLFRLRSMLGIISADLQHICDREMPCREVVLSGFFGSIGLYPNHRVASKMEDKTAEILDLLEIAHLADRDMTDMSSGQARRVLIGRALVHEPRALVLDEPNNDLDPRSARRFAEILRKLARSGRSVIMVTHRLQDIIPEIGRVIMIKDGRVFRDGAKRDVLTEANLSELFSIPVEVQEKGGYWYMLA